MGVNFRRGVAKILTRGSICSHASKEKLRHLIFGTYRLERVLCRLILGQIDPIQRNPKEQKIYSAPGRCSRRAMQVTPASSRGASARDLPNDASLLPPPRFCRLAHKDARRHVSSHDRAHACKLCDIAEHWSAQCPS